jgi:hypothetical protein
MKKLLIFFVFLSLILQSCSDEKIDILPQQDVNKLENISKSTGSTDCGSIIGNTFSGSGWHVYNETLNFCAEAGGTITILFDAADVPNRFFITDANRCTNSKY